MHSSHRARLLHTQSVRQPPSYLAASFIPTRSYSIPHPACSGRLFPPYSLLFGNPLDMQAALHLSTPARTAARGSGLGLLG